MSVNVPGADTRPVRRAQEDARRARSSTSGSTVRSVNSVQPRRFRVADVLDVRSNVCDDGALARAGWRATTTATAIPPAPKHTRPPTARIFRGTCFSSVYLKIEDAREDGVRQRQT